MKLIANWKEGWKFYTTWFFAFMLILPDIYTAAAALGLFDGIDPSERERLTFRILAVIGLALRFVKQAKPDVKGNEDEVVHKVKPGEAQS